MQCLQAGDITPEGVTADFDKGDEGWSLRLLHIISL